MRRGQRHGIARRLRNRIMLEQGATSLSDTPSEFEDIDVQPIEVEYIEEAFEYDPTYRLDVQKERPRP